MNRFALLFALGLFVFLFAYGCGSSEDTSDSTYKCQSQNDCPFSYVCYNGECVKQNEPCGGCPEGKECNLEELKCITVNCSSDRDCERPGLCDQSTGMCVGEPDKPEKCSPPCSEGFVCINGNCVVPPCRFDDDCHPDEFCDIPENARLGECKPIECSLDSDCRGGYVCDSSTNRCIQPCESDEDCGAGKECRAGHCEPLPPECETDYDCSHKKICDEYKQCVRGPACNPDDPASNDFCGENRVCDQELRRCVPYGCVSDDNCENGICDPQTHECVNKVPTGGGCVDDSQCLSVDICYKSVCHRKCDPYKPDEGCPFGYKCAVVKEGEHLGEGLGVCRPMRNGYPAGVVCESDYDCEVNLLCIESTCSGLCNPEQPQENWGCESNQTCTFNDTYGVGVCAPKPCDPETNPCPDGRPCHEGRCVDCVSKDDCEPHYYCEDYKCVPDCTISGCENGFCNATTGRCESYCVPPCEPWQDCIDGVCVEVECDPPCEDGYYCYHGECTEIPCSNFGQACGALADIPGAECCEGLVCCELYQGSGGYCCHECNADGTCAN